MKNSNTNQNDDDVELEIMSFSDFFLQLPVKVFLAFCAFIWTVVMCIVVLYIKFVK